MAFRLWNSLWRVWSKRSLWCPRGLRLPPLERFLKSSALFPRTQSGRIISWDSQDRFVPVFLWADQADGAVLTASQSCGPCQGRRRAFPSVLLQATGPAAGPGGAHWSKAEAFSPVSCSSPSTSIVQRAVQEEGIRKRNRFRGSVVILVSCNGKAVRAFRLKNSVEGETSLLVLWLELPAPKTEGLVGAMPCWLGN